MTTATVVQLRNPMTGHYIRINTTKGKITGFKKTPGPYKGIPVARKRRNGRRSGSADSRG